MEKSLFEKSVAKVCSWFGVTTIYQEDFDKIMEGKRQKNFRRHRFVGVDFSNLNLDDCNFSGVKLNRCSFAGSSLKNANFHKSKFGVFR